MVRQAILLGRVARTDGNAFDLCQEGLHDLLDCIKVSGHIWCKLFKQVEKDRKGGGVKAEAFVALFVVLFGLGDNTFALSCSSEAHGEVGASHESPCEELELKLSGLSVDAHDRVFGWRNKTS